MYWRLTKDGYIRHVGNYLRIKIKKEDEETWGMYLALRSWKQDGAEETKTHNYIRVAQLSGNSYKQALGTAEQKIREIIEDQAINAGLKVHGVQ